MPGVFISYRRTDTRLHALIVHDRVSRHFGKDNAFMDVVDIEPGADFAEVIQRKVGGCEVLLALIGKQWLISVDDEGNRRLDNPRDFVRLEIASAIQENILIIPVLIEGAKMPRSEDLPDEITALARRHALELGSEHFTQEIGRLISALEKTIGPSPGTGAEAEQPGSELAVGQGSILAEGGHKISGAIADVDQAPSEASRYPPKAEGNRSAAIGATSGREMEAAEENLAIEKTRIDHTRWIRIVKNRWFWVGTGILALAGVSARYVWIQNHQPTQDDVVHSYQRDLPYSEAALDPVQLMALFVAGLPPERIAQMAERDGVTFWPGSRSYTEHLRNAGASESLIASLSGLSSSYRERQPVNEAILSHLEKGANLKREGHLSEAAREYDVARGFDSKNPVLALPVGSFDLSEFQHVRSVTDDPVVIVSVDARGRIRTNNDLIEVSKLEGRLEDIFKTRAERIIGVREDPARPFPDLAKVISAAIDASIDKIVLVGDQRGSARQISGGVAKTN